MSHKVDYEFKIDLVEEQVSIRMTGETIEFTKLEERAVIRPRHTRLVTELYQLMKEYIRST